MTVEDIINPIVTAMTANGDSYTFLSTSEWNKNFLADDINLPLVFLTRPHRFIPTIVTGGGYRRRFICVALFLYKDTFENDVSQKAELIEKAYNAQRDFHIRLDNDTTNVKDLNVQECIELEHFDDANLCGVMMPFSFEMKENNSVCV